MSSVIVELKVGRTFDWKDYKICKELELKCIPFLFLHASHAPCKRLFLGGVVSAMTLMTSMGKRWKSRVASHVYTYVLPSSEGYGRYGLVSADSVSESSGRRRFSLPISTYRQYALRQKGTDVPRMLDVASPIATSTTTPPCRFQPTN